jgi:hypothetical protein
MPSKTCSALINEFTHAANQISKDEARPDVDVVGALLRVDPTKAGDKAGNNGYRPVAVPDRGRNLATMAISGEAAYER